MADFARPPTQDEMQYAGDAIRGKRKLDALIMAGAALVGAILGVAIGFAGSAAESKPVDVGFIALCAGICAAMLLVVAILVLFALRSLKAVCKVWVPARVVVAVAAVLIAHHVYGDIRFALIMQAGSLAAQLAKTAMMLIFAVLFLYLGVCLLFILYCMVTGKDEDEIMTRAISADQQRDDQDC